MVNSSSKASANIALRNAGGELDGPKSPMRSKNPSYARILKAGSSCVLYFASKSSVTYSESGGTWINGLSRRSHRVESCANPSLALM